MSLIVLLDLSAAFDTVDHQILLSVLENRFSVDSTALRWFESYLTVRVQSFSYADVQTPSFKVDCSVPQGSVLGPRCFKVDCSVPQGSVLGPRCFISYTEDIVDVLVSK